MFTRRHGLISLAAALSDRAQATGGLRLVADLPGGNAHPARSVLVDTDDGALLRLHLRNPEGGVQLWQMFRFALAGVAGRRIQVELALLGKEGGPQFRRSWAGPFVATRNDDPTAWQPVRERQWDGGTLRFVLEGGTAERLYVASMPPNTLPQCQGWIAQLARQHPAWVHDDLPSRRAAQLGPYTSGRTQPVPDELGRTIPPQPLLGLRIGPDAKVWQGRRFVVFASVHPGEDHGPLQLRGLVHEWLTAPALQALRESTELLVYPLISATGMAGGYRRREPRADLVGGSDLNHQWQLHAGPPAVARWTAIWRQDLEPALTRGGIDFHDVSPGGQLAWVYRPDDIPPATLQAVLQEHPRIGQVSTVGPGTLRHWLRSNTAAGVHGTALTAEVSDEAGSLADYAEVGARWARVAARWRDLGLLG